MPRSSSRKRTPTKRLLRSLEMDMEDEDIRSDDSDDQRISMYYGLHLDLLVSLQLPLDCNA